MKKKRKLHPTGQLSIFAILMFQILFILFAMSLNVALVVHDKINLQNSADLAAYYGAMKQAEMMNAIAHINYQIRQSWKLFVWRYRVLGNIGVAQSIGLSPQRWRDNGGKRELFPIGKRGVISRGPYIFCVGHRWWDNVVNKGSSSGQCSDISGAVNSDNLCVNLNSTIQPLTIPIISGVVGNFARILGITTQRVRNDNKLAGCTCATYGFNSWALGYYSALHFREDQSVRKFMIKRLAETIGAGRDLDGKSIELGVEATFRKNLSFINDENHRPLKHFNTLKGASVKAWLGEGDPVTTNVFYSSLENVGVRGTGCDKRIKYLHEVPRVMAPYAQELAERVTYNNVRWPDQCTDPFVCNPSAGILKNPRFFVYYAVEASLDYKNQIFLPGIRQLKLKAQAFAKPFGGRIGPPQGADKILKDGNEIYYLPGGIIGSFPNYSRYPGDTLGLRASETQRKWSFIRDVRGHKNVADFMKDGFPDDPDPLKRMVTGAGGEGRKWEMKAIAPDLFDVTYFTILPYYQHTYFHKVKKLMAEVGQENNTRGDLSYVNDNFFSRNSVLTHIKEANNPRSRQIFYEIKDKNLLLAGWNPPKQKYLNRDSYAGNTNFGYCRQWADSQNPNDSTGKIANGCIYGGRSGYSVKMISKNYIEGFNPSHNPPLPFR